jgi:hypothetical protein
MNIEEAIAHGFVDEIGDAAGEEAFRDLNLSMLDSVPEALQAKRDGHTDQRDFSGQDLLQVAALRSDFGASKKTPGQPGASNSAHTKEERAMPEAKEQGQASGENLEQAHEQAKREALEAEKNRRSEIREAFGSFKEAHGELLEQCLEDPDVTPDQARAKLLEEMGRHTEPAGAEPRVHAGRDESDKRREAMAEAIHVRAGLIDKPEGDNELRSYSLLELARLELERAGHRVGGDKLNVVGMAFTTTSNFPSILKDAAHKAMRMGYDEAPETFDMWTRRGNLSDFKPHNRPNLSTFSDLSEVPEHGEYEHGQFLDENETIQLATYGKLFSISRQAIINDDLDAFTRIPRRMGRAARRKVGDLVYDILINNPTMSDGNSLFDTSNHSNLASSGSAISVSSLGSARAAMTKQTDLNGNTLNIRPAYLIVPVEIEDTARQVLSSETDISKSNSRASNPVRNMAEVVPDPRLDANSATAWHLAADPNAFDTIEVGYLDGMNEPQLEEQDGWSVDGAEYKVRMDAAAAPLDWRTMYKDPGS